MTGKNWPKTSKTEKMPFSCICTARTIFLQTCGFRQITLKTVLSQNLIKIDEDEYEDNDEKHPKRAKIFLVFPNFGGSKIKKS